MQIIQGNYFVNHFFSGFDGVLRIRFPSRLFFFRSGYSFVAVEVKVRNITKHLMSSPSIGKPVSFVFLES